MAKLNNILDNSRSAFFKVLMNWTAIAGRSNRDIMKPARITRQILYVSVPNTMVLKTVRRFESSILANVQKFIGKVSIKEIKFFSDPSKFKETEVKKPRKKKVKPTVLDPSNVSQRSTELENIGIDGSLSKKMAEIELILKKQKENS